MHDLRFHLGNSNLKPARLKEHQAKHPEAEHEQTFQALLDKRARYDQRVHYSNLDSSQCKNRFYKIPMRWHTSAFK